MEAISDGVQPFSARIVKCQDCNPEGVKIYAEEFTRFHKLPYKTTLWALAQRLVCGQCGSKKVELKTEQPYPRGHRYRMARKGFSVR